MDGVGWRFVCLLLLLRESGLAFLVGEIGELHKAKRRIFCGVIGRHGPCMVGAGVRCLLGDGFFADPYYTHSALVTV